MLKNHYVTIAIMNVLRAFLIFLYKTYKKSLRFLNIFFIDLKSYVRNFSSNYKNNEEVRSIKNGVAFATDIIITFFSMYITSFFFEDDFFEYSSGFLLKNMIVFSLVTTGCFVGLKTHLSTLYVSARDDLSPLFVAIFISTLIYYPLMILMGQLESLSIATPFLNLFVCILILSIPRKIVTMLRNYRTESESNLIRTLLIGDTDHINLFIENKSKNIYKKFKPVAIITNNNKSNLKTINIPILSNVKKVEDIYDYCNDFDAIFTIGTLNDEIMKKVQYFCSNNNKPLMKILNLDKNPDISPIVVEKIDKAI